ncbi:MAG: hypothetical protein ACLVJ6_04300 [Merdibacter sp.]
MKACRRRSTQPGSIERSDPGKIDAATKTLREARLTALKGGCALEEIIAYANRRAVTAVHPTGNQTIATAAAWR